MKFSSLILLLVFLPQLAQASVCADLLGKISVGQGLERLFSADFGNQLVAKLRPQVESIYNRELKFSPEDLEEIFNLYMKERMSVLTREQQLSVREVMESGFRFKIYLNDPDSIPPFEANAHRGFDMIFLTLPASVYQTALDYFIRVHELEHIVQYAVMGKGIFSELHPTQILNQLNTEKGAMRSEASFLKLFPEEYLRSLIVAWRKDSHLKGLADEVFESVVNHAIESQDVDEYVRLQWKAGRYPKEVYLRRHWWFHAKFWSGTVALSAPIWLKWFGVY